MSTSKKFIQQTSITFQKQSTLDLIFNSQLIIALSSTSLAAESFLLCGYALELRVLALIFFSTLAVYNLAQLRIDITFSQKKTTRSASLHRLYFKVSLLALLPFLLFAAWMELLLFFLLAFATLAYIMPFVQNDSKVKGLRNIPVFKNIFLAFIWASATLALPLAAVSGAQISEHEVLVFIQRFFFILSLSLLFDIRDLRSDQQSGLLTLANVAGLNTIKVFAAAAIVIFLLLTFLDQFVYWQHFIYWPAFLLSGVFCFFLIAVSQPDKPRWYYAGFVESSTVLQFALFLSIPESLPGLI